MSDSKIAKKWFDVFTSGKYSSKDQARAKAEAVRVFQVMNDRSFNLVFADDSVLGIQQEPTDDPVIVKHFFKWGICYSGRRVAWQWDGIGHHTGW